MPGQVGPLSGRVSRESSNHLELSFPLEGSSVPTRGSLTSLLSTVGENVARENTQALILYVLKVYTKHA